MDNIVNAEAPVRRHVPEREVAGVAAVLMLTHSDMARTMRAVDLMILIRGVLEAREELDQAAADAPLAQS